MPGRDEILQQAMQLAPQDRAYVADALEQSLDAQGFASPELAEAWAAEIERRVAACDRHEVSAADKDSTLAQLRRALSDFRARKVAS
ncbi:MAG TPA: addiction module protein [Pirellulales bacterium]|nr:addiction module protein [Pirellulales bacterium]